MASKTEEVVEETVNQPTRNWGKIIFLSGLALLMVWIGLKTWRIGSAAYAFWQMKNEAQTMLDGGLTSINPDDAEQMVFDARANFLTIKNETEFLMPITPHLGWVPTVGPLFINAQHFIEMGDAGTETAIHAVRGLKPALAVLQSENSGESRLPALVTVISDARPDLAHAEMSFQQVVAAYEQLEKIEAFPDQLQPVFALADEMIPLAEDGFKLVQVLPQIAGADVPKTYLILAQNDDELRATGGFITGVGVLTVDNGRIMQLDFQDAVLIDSISNGLYDYPPQPFQQFMGLDYFVFRDANFWPDFPTSAENAIKLYALGQNIDPTTFDGVIAIDQPFLELLVEGTGPIPINGAELTLTGENVIDTLRNTWVSRSEVEGNFNDWLFSRKDFLSIFAGEIRNRLENDISSVNPILLSRNLYEAIQTKRLQLYFRDPEVVQVLETIDWDGRLENLQNQDFLMVVDTNMGYNKANVYVARNFEYQVLLKENLSGEANLWVTHTHTGPENNSLCDQNIEDDYQVAENYLEIADQCYFNYLRVYVPQQAQLINSTQQTIRGDYLLSGIEWNATAQPIQELNNLNTYENFMVLPHATTVTNEFTYNLPNNIVQKSGNDSIYRLQIQKQAGTNEEPLKVIITLPPNANFVQATPIPTKVEGSQITFDLNLTSDEELELIFN